MVTKYCRLCKTNKAEVEENIMWTCGLCFQKKCLERWTPVLPPNYYEMRKKAKKRKKKNKTELAKVKIAEWNKRLKMRRKI
jgi:hypothetical protein